MRKIIVIISLACLLTGGGIAYLASYLIYTPMLEDCVAQINDQNDQISQLVQINCNLEHTVNENMNLIATQKSEIDSLKLKLLIRR